MSVAVNFVSTCVTLCGRDFSGVLKLWSASRRDVDAIPESSVDVLKKAFYRRVAKDLAELGLRKEDVVINLVEVHKENWSFGNGEMQYGAQ